MTSHVLPQTRCDLYSYSAYDTCVDGKRFRAALDYLAARCPDSPTFGAKNVYIGEFGIPENEHGTTASLAATRRTAQEALAWGCPYIVYWQLYDNATGSLPRLVAHGGPSEETRVLNPETWRRVRRDPEDA